jgi:hypothetical protein
MKNRDTLLLEAAYSNMYHALTPDGPEANEPGHHHALTPDGPEANEPGHYNALTPDGPEANDDGGEEVTRISIIVANIADDIDDLRSMVEDINGELSDEILNVFEKIDNKTKEFNKWRGVSSEPQNNALTPDGPKANKPGQYNALTPDGPKANKPGHYRSL